MRGRFRFHASWVVGLLLLSWTMLPLAGPGASATTSTWTKVTFGETGLPDGTSIEALVEYRGSLIAAGWFGARASGGLPFQGAVWRSDDGHRWEEVGHGAFAPGRIVALVATDTELFALLAPLLDARPDPPLSVWASADGVTWELRTSEGPTDVRQLLALDDTLIGAGSDRRCAEMTPNCVGTAIWISENGAQWRRAGPEEMFPPGVVTGVVASRTGLVAVGVPTTGTGVDRPVYVWTSQDGQEWRRISDLEGISPGSYLSGALASGRARTMTIGIAPADDNSPPTTVVTRTPAITSTAANGGLAVARICAESAGVTTAWTTTDAVRWSAILTPALAATSVRTLVRVGNRWIVGGAEGDCSSTQAVVYSSRSGRRWTREAADSPPENPSGDGPIRYVNVVAPTSEGGVLAVVNTLAAHAVGGGPDIWISTTVRDRATGPHAGRSPN